MMMKLGLFILGLALLIAPDAAANDMAGEATQMITDAMRAILGVIVEFIGDVLNEFVLALKNFF